MTEVAIETERRPITEWLPRQNSLGRDGRRSAGHAQEFRMAHIDKLFERARKGPTKSLAEIKAKFGIKDKAKGGGKRRNGKHRAGK